MGLKVEILHELPAFPGTSVASRAPRVLSRPPILLHSPVPWYQRLTSPGILCRPSLLNQYQAPRRPLPAACPPRFLPHPPDGPLLLDSLGLPRYETDYLSRLLRCSPYCCSPERPVYDFTPARSSFASGRPILTHRRRVRSSSSSSLTRPRALSSPLRR